MAYNEKEQKIVDSLRSGEKVEEWRIEAAFGATFPILGDGYVRIKEKDVIYWQKLSLKIVYDKIRNCEEVSDAELKYIHDKFKIIDELCRETGDIFRLAADEAFRVQQQVKGFIEARKEK